MLNKIRNTINKYGMFLENQSVSVALSGGADSVCLLYALLELKDEFGLSISALHLNHKLRGNESDRDEQFVRDLCQKLRVPLVVEAIDISLEAEKRGESIELAARNIRYDFYKRNAEGIVAVAHTASDNLETVIYNLSRGSGIRGFCGIPPVRDIYVRPLIELTSDEVREYLSENNIEFVVDSSNLTDDYTRNFIRHNIVPNLKKLNPSVEQTVSASGENIREDEKFLTKTSKKIYCISLLGDGLDAKLLLEQPVAIAKRVLSMYFTEIIGGNADSLHIKRMYNTLKNGGKLSLPKNFSAVCNKTRFEIISNEKKENGTYKTEIVYEALKKNNNVYNLLLKNAIDCDKIVGSLKIRTREEGDFIKLKGRNCTKSLKKLFNEMKIPVTDRENLPVAVDDEGIVWIYGIGVAERSSINENTVNIAHFNVNKSELLGEVKND